MKMKQILIIVAGMAIATVMAEAKGGGGGNGGGGKGKQSRAQNRKQDSVCRMVRKTAHRGAKVRQQKKSGPRDMTGPRSRDGSCDRM